MRLLWDSSVLRAATGWRGQSGVHASQHAREAGRVNRKSTCDHVAKYCILPHQGTTKRTIEEQFQCRHWGKPQ